MKLKEAIKARMEELALTPHALGGRIESKYPGKGKTVRNYLYGADRICKSDTLELILQELGLFLAVAADVPEWDAPSA